MGSSCTGLVRSMVESSDTEKDDLGIGVDWVQGQANTER